MLSFFCAGADASTELVASASALCSCFESRGVSCIILATISHWLSDVLEQFSDAGQLATFESCSLPPLDWQARWLVRGSTVIMSSASSRWAQSSAASFELLRGPMSEGGQEGLCSCLPPGWTPVVTCFRSLTGVSVSRSRAVRGCRALLAVELERLWAFLTRPLQRLFSPRWPSLTWRPSRLAALQSSTEFRLSAWSLCCSRLSLSISVSRGRQAA